MAIHDKFRAFMFGLPIGVPACELAGEKVLLFKHVPYELEEPFARWLLLHDDLVDRDSPACAIRFDERERIGVTWSVWGSFLDWMVTQLGACFNEQDVGHDTAHALREGIVAGTPISSLPDGSALYFDDVPVELRAALYRWLDASPDMIRRDESGCEAILWDDWEKFLRYAKRTLSAALNELEITHEARNQDGA